MESKRIDVRVQLPAMVFGGAITSDIIETIDDED